MIFEIRLSKNELCMRKFLFLYEISNNIIDSIVTQGSTKFTLRPM